MIRLFYSNATEELLHALGRALREERARSEAGPLEPVRLIVPNRNVETYVKLGLAAASGVAANIEVTFLRRFLARVAERGLPRARAADADLIEGQLLAVLHDDVRLARPELEPVRDYLGAAGTDPDAVDRRRCQLAAELGRLFDEYASSRPKLLASWRVSAAATPASGPPREAGATERWQRALWLEIFGQRGLLAERSAREGTTFLPLADLLAAAGKPLDVAALGRTLHLFGVSYVAESYHRMLALLGKQIDVRIYTLNPCREFWEDLETAGEAARSRKRARRRLFPTRNEGRQSLLGLGADPFGLETDDEMLALRLWGRPGRENIRLLNQLTDADFESRFRVNADADADADADGKARTPSLLQRLQDDILDRVARSGPDETATAAPDDSITVLPCPGLRRELEVVAAEIWRMVRADPTLRFNQIAVIVPESRKAAYQAQVGAVFGESHDLPHSVIDLPLGDAHGMGEAIAMLLDLPLGSFSRREILPLITHPSVLSPARFPGASAGDWIRLCDDLGIVHGADRRDHRDTYIDGDLFNWDQGVRRIALGALMTGPRSGEDAPVVLGGRPYLPAEPPAGQGRRGGQGGDGDGGLGFALLVRSLIEDARLAAGVTGPRARPLGEWLEFIRGLLTGYLVPADEGEAGLIGRCLGALAELEEVGLDGPGAPPVSYRVAVELCRRRFAGLAGERGQHLARGVAVASFVPMRAIPFRAVFLVGLGHGQFPAPARRSDLDLRGAQRVPGDVSPREQDLYMFLETLLCTRERLVLSYVARDELTGEPLEPSSAILELRDILTRGYLGADRAKALFEPAPAIPLRRYDDDSRLDAHPLAVREQQARALRRSLQDALPPGAPAPDLRQLALLLPDDRYRPLAASLGQHPPPRATKASRAGAGAGRVVVSLQDLRQFLEDPLQGSARFRLRMRDLDGDGDVPDREEEPFETERPRRLYLLREAMLAALARPPSGPALETHFGAVLAGHQALVRREELLGHGPTGVFRAAERPGDEEILRTWWREALEAGGGKAPRGRIVRFGRAAELEAADDIRDPIIVDASPNVGVGVDVGVDVDVGAGDRTVRVEIVGRTELIVGADDAADAAPTGSLVFSCRGARDDNKVERELLRAFVDHVALAAAGLGGGAHAALLAVADERDIAASTLQRRAFAPLSGDRARTYLAALVADLLLGQVDSASGVATGVHPYLLPREAIFEHRRKGTPLVEVIEELRENYLESPFGGGFSSTYGPVPNAVERHHPPAPDDAARMAASRFDLLFELLVDEESAP